jgi:hypothetical protein
MTIYIDFKRNYKLSTIFTTILSKLLRELKLYVYTGQSSLLPSGLKFEFRSLKSL